MRPGTAGSSRGRRDIPLCWEPGYIKILHFSLRHCLGALFQKECVTRGYVRPLVQQRIHKLSICPLHVVPMCEIEFLLLENVNGGRKNMIMMDGRKDNCGTHQLLITRFIKPLAYFVNQLSLSPTHSTRRCRPYPRRCRLTRHRPCHPLILRVSFNLHLPGAGAL